MARRSRKVTTSRNYLMLKGFWMHECHLNDTPYTSSVIYADGVVCPTCKMTREHRVLQEDYKHLLKITEDLKQQLKRNE